MKKALLKKIMSAVISSIMITSLFPIGVSAEWRRNSDRTWSYIFGDERVNGWKIISGGWYYFNKDGIMKIGWTQDNGNWYYLNYSGKMQTGWIKDNDKWYYLDNTGKMQTGWVQHDGKWYYLNYRGAMHTGWIRDNGKWYYLDTNGEMKTGIVSISNKIYYFNFSGELEQANNYLNKTISENNSTNISSSSAIGINGLPQVPNNYAISIQAYAESKILELMNKKRTEAGLNPLILDDTLVKIARYKSNHMIQYNYFDHTTPYGQKWTSWLDNIDYQYTTTGENIAYNNYDPVELFNQWWNSPGHKANMMNSSYGKVGIGVIEGNGKFMGTQTFSN